MMPATHGIIMWLLLAAVPLSAQELRQPLVRFSHPRLDIINKKVETREYERAIELSLQAAAQMKAESNHEGYISFMLRAAEIETFEVWKGKGLPEVHIFPDYRRPQRYLESLMREAGGLIEAYPNLEADALHTSAVVYQWLEMPDTSEILHSRALPARKKIYGESSREVADSYLWMGRLYYLGLQRKDLAQANYRKALDLQKKFMPDSRFALGSVYFGLANIAREDFQFDEALMMANEYLALYRELPYEQGFGLQLIANVYSNQGDFEKSLEYRRKIIELYEESDFDDDLIIEYSNLASVLMSLKRYEEAEQALKESHKILSHSNDKHPMHIRILSENFGDLYRLMKKYDASNEYLQKALHTAEQQYGGRNDKVAFLYQLIGDVFKDQGNVEMALKNYQKMLNSVIPGFTTTDLYAIPDIQTDSPYFITIIGGNFCKADAFLSWYKESGNVEHLESALAHYRNAFDQIIVARQTIGDEISKAFLMSNFYESIENSISSASLMYQRTRKEKFISDVFYLMELTKYLNVLDAQLRAERANNSGIPSTLLFQLDDVKKELGRLQRIQMDYAHLRLSDDSVASLREHIFDLIKTRRELMSEILAYSGAAHISFDSIILTTTDVRSKLDSDKQIIEYFWGKDSIYVLSMTSESSVLMTVANDSEMDSLLLSVHNILSNRSTYKAEQVIRYSRLTSRIYRKLFEPVIKRNVITIIPDGPLNLVPVEALVVNHQEDSRSFRDLAYLIYDHEVSYAYSSTILFTGGENDTNKIDDVLAFSYSGDLESKRMVKLTQLVPIPGTFRETETLSRLFKNVKVFADADASKKNFLDHAPQYDLIHIAVHGVSDADVVNNSRLIFRGDTSGLGDLYAYEVYNLNLEAGLVVLSACETGLGKHQSGEGIFSIARAFSYAGCPSVVMSLWQVGDNPTSSIMEKFYENLSEGNSIGASLRASKLHFLQESDEFSAHPWNWAAFVVNGTDKAFRGGQPKITFWFILVTIATVLGYVLLKRRAGSSFPR